jgi:hypothetical protein
MSITLKQEHRQAEHYMPESVFFFLVMMKHLEDMGISCSSYKILQL